MGGGQSYLGEKGEKGEPAVIEPVSEVFISPEITEIIFFPRSSGVPEKSHFGKTGSRIFSLLMLKLQDSTGLLTI